MYDFLVIWFVMVGAAAGWVEFAFVFCNVGNYELDTMDLNRVVHIQHTVHTLNIPSYLRCFQPLICR